MRNFLYFFEAIWWVFPLSVVYIRYQKWESKKRELIWYGRRKSPIFECQIDIHDSHVFKRAEYHRQMLVKAGNTILTDADVHELYILQMDGVMLETMETYNLKNGAYIQNENEKFFKKMSEKSPESTKKLFYNQEF